MMKYQKGNAVVWMVVAVATVLGLIVGIASYVSAANYGNRAEVAIQAIWENNQNILGQYTLKIQEAAQIPEMYKNDLKEVLSAEMSSRYGKDGSQASMQWIKEHSVNFDSSMHRKMQSLIEAGRNEFQNNQTRLIDEKRTYKTSLGTIPRKWFLSMAGYPMIDLDKFKPVVAGDTRQAFETGVQAPIKLR
jgi:hypothetical protein